MSKMTEVLQTGNQLIGSYDFSKLALGSNEFAAYNYTASGDTTLAQGLVLGKIAATGALTTLTPGATNGSQFPIGILYLGLTESKTILDGVTESLTLINKGRVDIDKLSFPGVVTIDTVITSDGRTMKDYLLSMGIMFEDGVELTKLDNQ